jgi:phage-related protein
MDERIQVEITADIDRFISAMQESGKAAKQFEKDMNNMKAGIASAFAPSAIAGAGALSVGLGALGASAIAAGSGFALLATVAVPVFSDLADGYKEVTKAEEAYANADTAKEKAAALKELEKAYAGMSDAQRTTTKEMQAFGEFYTGFAKQFEIPILETFVKSMRSARGLLTSFEGTIGSLIGGVGELFDSFNANLQAPDVLSFFEFMDTYAKDSLVTLGQAFGNTFVGILNILNAFSPVIDSVNGGLLSASQSFRNWSASLENSEGVKTFLEYGMSNLPKFMNILGGLGSAFVSIVQTLAPLGAAMLSVGSAIVDVFKSVNQAIPGFDKLAVAIGAMAAAFYLLPANALRMWAVALTGIVMLIPSITKAFEEQGTEGFNSAITNIVASINTFFTEQLPTLIPQGLAMVMTIIQGIGQALPHVLTGAIQIIGAVVTGIAQNLPQLLDAGLSIILGLTNAILQSLPQVIQSATEVMRNFIDTVSSKIPEITVVVTEMLTLFINTISQNLPLILEAGVDMLMQIIDGIVQNLPKIIDATVKVVDSLLTTIANNLPQILESGVKILLKIVDGIVDNLPKIIQAAKDLIGKVVNTISANLPQILAAGGKILAELIWGILEAVPKLLLMIVTDVIPAILTPLSEIDLVEVGINLIKGLIDGILSMGSTLLNKAGDLAGDVLDKFTGIFKIFSPSRVMRDLVGKNLVKGWIIGLDSMRGDLARSAEDLANVISPERLDASLQVSTPSAVRGLRVADATVGNNTIQPQKVFQPTVYVQLPENASEAQALRKQKRVLKQLGTEMGW